MAPRPMPPLPRLARADDTKAWADQIAAAIELQIRQMVANEVANELTLVNFNKAFLTWMASLPTTLPATGLAWNNGGIPSVSQ